MRSFTDDFPARLVHLQLPAAHRQFVSTTNLIERRFEEERRGTKTIPRFFDEHSALKLVFGALTHATARWRRLTPARPHGGATLILLRCYRSAPL